MSLPPPIGVLGGTFDPVHLGHLEIARRAREAARLERVLLLPSATPPHKRAAHLAPAADREAMLRLAVSGIAGLEVSTIEIETGRVCYTIDTLRKLRGGRPPAAPLFVLGMDSLTELHTWKDHRDLIREFDLIVFDRPGSSPVLAPEVERALVELADPAAAWRGMPEPGRGGRIFRFRLPPIEISSSRIRARAAAGRDLHGLVPPAVAGYIATRGLYGRDHVEENR